MKVGFIVEGTHDEAKLLLNFPSAKFAITKGTRFSKRTKMDIQGLIDSVDQAFILTDPDESGDALAEMISAIFSLPRIHLEAERCMCYRNRKLKIGVEHADDVYLKSVLEPILAQYQNKNEQYD